MALKLHTQLVSHLRSAIVFRVGSRTVLLTLEQARTLYGQLGEALSEAETTAAALGSEAVYAAVEVEEEGDRTA